LNDSYGLIVSHSGDIASKGISSPEGSTKLHIVPSGDGQPLYHSSLKASCKDMRLTNS
jgi:hypothetical protein